MRIEKIENEFYVVSTLFNSLDVLYAHGCWTVMGNQELQHHSNHQCLEDAIFTAKAILRMNAVMRFTETTLNVIANISYTAKKLKGLKKSKKSKFKKPKFRNRKMMKI